MSKLKLKDFLFIIPARKNSKGIKNKNFLKLNKKFLIEYTFDKLNSIDFTRKYLLSDSKFGFHLAKKYKVNCSYIRPKYLSLDNTSLIDNLIHFNNVIKNKIEFKYYVILQPTSPLRSKRDIFESIKEFKNKKFESLYSISPSFEHPFDTLALDSKKFRYFNKKKKLRRQLYPKSFFINGAIYIFNKQLLKKKTFYSEKKHGYFVMKKINSIDLDDYQDLELLKKLIK